MTYDLKAPSVPRLAGTPLRVVTRIAESQTLGGIVYRQMVGNMGFPAFRRAPVGNAPIAPWPVLPEARDPGPHTPPDTDALVEEPTEQRGFAFETAADFRAAYRDKRTDPVEVAERVLAAIRESEGQDPKMRVFIAHNPDDVRAQAKASKERWDKGEPIGPLDGVPIAVKDEVDMRGYPTTIGTRFHGKGGPAREDGTAVARLRAAGAILLGKANMTEIGIGPIGLNPHHGTPRNPYDPRRFTGGSSSGSGASVAAGLGPIALGADGGGSIRHPASFCGVVGLKATFGRVSEHGVPPVCWSVAHLGPIAATARDCALGYALLAGPDERDRHSRHQPPVTLEGIDRTDDLSDVTLGVFRPWFEDADPAVVRECKRMLAHLEAKGAKVKEIEVPGLDNLRVAHLITIGVEMLTAQRPYFEKHRQDYATDVRLLFAGLERLPSSDYVHAQRHRHVICEQFDRLLQEVDVIVTPTNACTAPLIQGDALSSGESNLSLLSKVMRFVPAANMTGLPAISFPAGYDDEGMPVGFQAMGRAWEEALLLRLAIAAEDGVERRAPRWHKRLLS